MRQTSEVGFLEDVDLEIFAPWKDLDQLGSVVDQFFIFSTESLVDDSSETLVTQVELMRACLGLSMKIRFTFPFGLGFVRNSETTTRICWAHTLPPYGSTYVSTNPM